MTGRLRDEQAALKRLSLHAHLCYVGVHFGMRHRWFHAEHLGRLVHNLQPLPPPIAPTYAPPPLPGEKCALAAVHGDIVSCTHRMTILPLPSMLMARPMSVYSS